VEKHKIVVAKEISAAIIECKKEMRKSTNNVMLRIDELEIVSHEGIATMLATIIANKSSPSLVF
jgi:nitrate reductase NapAB chaperone NapD